MTIEIETDIKDSRLASRLEELMESAWSGPVHNTIQEISLGPDGKFQINDLTSDERLAVDVHMTQVLRKPDGARKIGIVVDSDWPYTLPESKCGVIHLPSLLPIDAPPHELGHIFGFEHGFFDIAEEVNGELAIRPINLFPEDNMMGYGNVVHPYHRRELIREVQAHQ